MAGSGSIILVSYGEENMFLNDDPQITFFKIIYRRYTTFCAYIVDLLTDLYTEIRNSLSERSESQVTTKGSNKRSLMKFLKP